MIIDNREPMIECGEFDTTFTDVDDVLFTEGSNLLASIEQVYGEVMIEQAKEEFEEFKNEGTILAVNEGFIEKVKEFFAKLFNKIKIYFKKFLNMLSSVFSNCYRFFVAKKNAINAGCAHVENFKGYTGLKSFNTVNKMITNTGNALTIVQFGEWADVSAINNAVNAIANKISGGDASEFQKKILKAIRVDENPVELKYSFGELQAVLGQETYTTLVSSAIKTVEASIRDLERKANAKDPGKETAVFAMAKRCMALMTTSLNICTRSVKDVISQANSYAHKAVSVAIGASHEAVSMTQDDYFQGKDLIY